jgi:hypothetical protein
VGVSPTRQPLPAGSNRTVVEVTKWLKPSISVSRIGDSGWVKQGEEYAQPLRRGSGDSMYTRKAYATRKPQSVVSNVQPEARKRRTFSKTIFYFFGK